MESPVVCIRTLIRRTGYKRPQCKRKNISVLTCMRLCPVANIFLVVFKENSKLGNCKLPITFKFLLKDLCNKIDRQAVKRKQIKAPLKLKTFRDWHIVQLAVSLLTVNNGCALILNTFQYGFMYGNWRSGNHGLIRNVTRKLAILLFY